MIPRHRIKSSAAKSKWAARWNQFLLFYFKSIVIQLSILLVATTSCILYLVEANMEDVGMAESTFYSLNIFFFCVFLLDYLLNIAAARRKVDYIFSFIGFADLASLVPVIGTFIAGQNNQYNFATWPPSWLGYLRFFRLMQIFHLFRLRNTMQSSTLRPHDAALTLSISEIQYQIVRLIIR